MSATYRAIQPIATGRLRAADLPITEPARHILSLLVLALILGMPTAHAEDQAKQEVTRLSEHPAVIVARRGIQVDPTSKFHLHPALSRGLQRIEDRAKQGVTRLGEHPAVIVARRGVQIDPTAKFHLHPALSRSLQRPTTEREEPALLVAD